MPAAPPMGAIAVGAITSGVCYFSATMRAKSKLDDSLDAFAVHGVGGFTGALLTGIFSTELIKGSNSAAVNGLAYGNPSLFFTQFKVTASVAIYTFVVSFILCKVLKAVMGLRVGEEQESRGLDLSLHGEEGYAEASSA